jgi:hypothetical protein
LGGVPPAAAEPFEGREPFGVAQPLFNPRVVPPRPKVPWYLTPSCQVIVRASPVTRIGVNPFDLWYCELPPFVSHQASIRCSCMVPVDGRLLSHIGMVVWRPTQWRYVIDP